MRGTIDLINQHATDDPNDLQALVDRRSAEEIDDRASEIGLDDGRSRPNRGHYFQALEEVYHIRRRLKQAA
jgi:hypothetical protein